MTEQEAYDKGYKQGYADRIEMERALRADDCISREEFIKRISPYNTDDSMDKALYNFAFNKILDCPSVKPTRAKGKWIEHEKVYECSECQIIRAKGTTGKYNYCPSCGADMRGEVQE